MDDIVNTLDLIRQNIRGSGIAIRYDRRQDRLHVKSPNGVSTSLKVTRLYRPSSRDVIDSATTDSLLVISAATEKAAKAASTHNHILIPKGSYRIIAPGLALINNSEILANEPTSRQVRLMGRTGVIAESLLIGGGQRWSVRQLAVASRVSPGLAQRVVNRLERESLLTPSGSGREKTRVVSDPRALAELWSQEEKVPVLAVRGFLYGPSNEAVARRVLDLFPGSAVGETLAANLYAPILTRVTPPIRIWVTGNFKRDTLDAHGFEETDEGANIELVRVPDDPWQIHMTSAELPRISKWRAWVEVSHAQGRVQELAEALLTQLEEPWNGTD